MLLKVLPDGYKNMAVYQFAEMSLFLTSITFPEKSNPNSGHITVTFTPPEGSDSSPTSIDIPLSPDTSNLEKFKVSMHRSPTDAYIMPTKFNDWFTSCFGFPVILAYLGDHRREVRFEEMMPAKENGWLSTLSKLPTAILRSSESTKDSENKRITFADCAPFLVTSQASLEDVSARLPDGVSMDVTKFRPNIVLSGASAAWEEDFWAELVTGNVTLSLVHNCARCKSINVDYRTGKPGEGEEGNVLKKLQRDRRVDPGMKWSPVFGRYAFLAEGGDGEVIRIGDEAKVTKVNKERTVFSKCPV